MIAHKDNVVRIGEDLTKNISKSGGNHAAEIELHGEDLAQHRVNEEVMSTTMYIFVALSAILIVCVNVPIIKAITDYTFINILVILDCLDSIAHIPILAQFFL